MTPLTPTETARLRAAIVYLDAASSEAAPLETFPTNLTEGAHNPASAVRWIEARAEIIVALREIDHARDTLARYAQDPPF